MIININDDSVTEYKEKYGLTKQYIGTKIKELISFEFEDRPARVEDDMAGNEESEEEEDYDMDDSSGDESEGWAYKILSLWIFMNV